MFSYAALKHTVQYRSLQVDEIIRRTSGQTIFYQRNPGKAMKPEHHKIIRLSENLQ